MKLVVRPKPLPLESLRGYILRLTEKNGYPSPDYILSAMRGHQYRATVGRLDARTLVGLAGISNEQAAYLTLQPDEKPKAFVRLYGNDIPSYEVVTSRPRICPHCLAEGGICEAFWDLAQAAACPVHCVTLVDTCAGCGETLSWTRQKVLQCRCGYDLSTLPTLKAPEALCKLMAVMRGLLYQDPQRAALPAEMGHLAHLSIRKLCKLLWVMTGTLYSQHSENGVRSSPKARRAYKSQLERIAEALTNWPSGYRRYLTEAHARELDDSHALPSFRILFNWLLIRLIKHDKDGGADYDFLLEQTYHFGADYWTRSAMMRSEEDAWMLPERMRWGTMGEAAAFLGVHMATLKKLIGAKELREKRHISTSGKRGIVLDLDQIRQQKQSEYHAVSIRLAGKHLGISVQILKRLRAMGGFQTHHRTFPGSIAWEDIEAFATRIRSITQGKRTNRRKDVITIDVAMRRYDIHLEERARFALHLLDHPELIVGSSGQGFGNMLILATTAQRILRQEIVAGRARVSVQQAAIQLKCTFADVTALKKAGHLVEDQSTRRGQVCKDSIDTFDQKYEVMRSIARRMSVPVKRIYARVDMTGIGHIKVSNTQHSTIFVERKYLPLTERRVKEISGPRS